MLQYIEATGKNEEEAVNAALRKLGLDRDEVSVEVLERAKSGFLGIGGSPAKVKVTYEVPDPPKPEEPRAEAPKAQPVKAEEPAAPVSQPKTEPDAQAAGSAPAGDRAGRAQSRGPQDGDSQSPAGEGGGPRRPRFPARDRA